MICASRPFRRACLAVLLGILLPGGIPAQEQEQEPDFAEQAERWSRIAETAREALDRGFERTSADGIKAKLRESIDAATAARREARVRLDSSRQMLASLGDPPPEGKSPESRQLAELRSRIRERVRTTESRVAQAGLAISRGNELLQSIAAWEQARFRAEVLTHRPPPVTPSVWRQAVADAAAFGTAVIAAPSKWWNALPADRQSRVLWIYFLGVPLAGAILGWPTRLWLMRHFGRSADEPEPSYARRIIAAVADGVANAIIPAAIIALTVGALALQGVLTGIFALVVYALGTTLAGYLVVFGLAKAAVAPRLVAWRVAPINPAYAPALLRGVWGIAASLATALAVLATAFEANMLTPALESALLTAQTLVTGGLMVWITAPRFWESSVAASQDAGSVAQAQEAEAEEEQEATPKASPAPARRRGQWRPVARSLLRGVIVLTPLMALTGYARLAFYIQSRVAATAVIVGFAMLVRLAIREMLPRVLPVSRETGVTRAATVYWTGLVLDFAIILPMLYALLLLFGIPATTVSLWLGYILSGIDIGGFTLSLGGILTAVLVLAAGLVITNLARRWLSQRVLPNTRLDAGARNSIASGSSYIGVAVALVLAVTALGVDFSNLALVAGALSVGIGFGLQNVVQNFAAGLLLLIERPIKVGDWVIVGGVEGTVKHISVRSTEIETFDRSSVIVPNSDFISSPVTNWTHKNRTARIIVRVGIAHGSDTARVEETLLGCARAHRRVLRYPPPAVYLMSLGDSALAFELRCYIDDTDAYLVALSELNVAVDAAFREAEITIAYPQRDLHVHSVGHGEAEPEATEGGQTAQALGARTRRP